MGGDFIIAQGCTGCSTGPPVDLDISEMGNTDETGGDGQSFGMTMMQTGSNYRKQSEIMEKITITITLNRDKKS